MTTEALPTPLLAPSLASLGFPSTSSPILVGNSSSSFASYRSERWWLKSLCMHFVVQKKMKKNGEENRAQELASAEARKDGEGWRGGKRVSLPRRLGRAG